MSDLRDQLIEAAAKASVEYWVLCRVLPPRDEDPGTYDDELDITTGGETAAAIDAIWPLVEAALTRARQEGREQAEKAERELAEPTEYCGRSAAHPAHKYMFARQAYRCPGLDADV